MAGRIELSLNLKEQANVPVPDVSTPNPSAKSEESSSGLLAADCPPLNIVIFIVGSRGESSIRML
jgi:hypothetical protein